MGVWIRAILRGGAALGVAVAASGCGGDPSSPISALPVAPPRAAVNAPERCAPCHAAQVADWHAGGHSRSLRPATPATVGMPVPGALEAPGNHGASVRFEGTQLQMQCLGDDGATRDYPVHYVIGGRKLEMYVTETGADRRPQVLPAMWSNRESRFIPYWAIDLKREPSPVEHTSDRFWTQRQRTFVSYCHRCHSPETAVTYDPVTGHYGVDWGPPEHVGVQCVACHGDATTHVRDAERGVAAPALPGRNPRPDQRAVAEVEACGWCHVSGEWLDLGYRPGRPFFDHFMPLVLDDTLHFWPDGRYRDHAYLYLAHEMSRCFQRGALRCTDCHAVHGDRDAATTRATSLAACMRCHDALPVACTSHAGDAAATRPDCLACHMPPISIERGHGRMHDHRIAIPDPTLSKEAGIPNACTPCHATQPVEFAESALKALHVKTPWRRAPALAIDAALKGRAGEAAPGLRAALADHALPWPVRATAARLLANAASLDSAAAVVAALNDAHPMVRAGAAYGCIGQPGPEVMAALRAARTDAVRVVRVMVAASLIIRGEPADLPEALAQIERVTADVTDQLDMYRLLAMGYERMGDWRKARAAHAAVARMVPREPGAKAAREAFELRAPGAKR